MSYVLVRDLKPGQRIELQPGDCTTSSLVGPATFWGWTANGTPIAILDKESIYASRLCVYTTIPGVPPLNPGFDLKDQKGVGLVRDRCVKVLSPTVQLKEGAIGDRVELTFEQGKVTGRIVGSVLFGQPDQPRIGVVLLDEGQNTTCVGYFTLTENDASLAPQYSGQGYGGRKARSLYGHKSMRILDETQESKIDDVKIPAEGVAQASNEFLAACRREQDMKRKRNSKMIDAKDNATGETEMTRGSKAIARLKKSKDQVPYRVARIQALTTGKRNLIRAAKSHLPENVSSAAEGFLETDVGQGVVLALIGLLGPMTPKYGEHPVVEAMCSEFLEEGMALGSNQVLTLLGSLIEPALKSAIDAMPETVDKVKETVKPTKRKRVAVPKNVIPMTKAVEMASEDWKEKPDQEDEPARRGRAATSP